MVVTVCVSCGFAEGAKPFLPPAELTSTGLSNLTNEFTGGIILLGACVQCGAALLTKRLRNASNGLWLFLFLGAGIAEFTEKLSVRKTALGLPNTATPR